MSIPTDPTELRNLIAATIWERENPGQLYADCEPPWNADAEEDADAVLAKVVQPLLDGKRAATEAADAPPTLLAQVLAEQAVPQADLARRTNLSAKHINQLCQGKTRMSVDVALRLEFTLGVPAEEWMRAYTDTWISEQRDTVTLAAFRQQLAWWKKARMDDLDQIGRLSDERDDLRLIARSAAVSLRDTAERVEQGRAVNAVALRAAARAIDEIAQPKETS